MVLRHVVIGSRRFEETYRLRLQALSPKTPDNEGSRSFRNVAIRLPRNAESCPSRTQYKEKKFVVYFIVSKWQDWLRKASRLKEADVNRAVFLNRRAAARYRALASIIPGRERFSSNLSFWFSKNFSYFIIFYYIRECVENLRPRCWPEETKICYKISLVQ